MHLNPSYNFLSRLNQRGGKSIVSCLASGVDLAFWLTPPSMASHHTTYEKPLKPSAFPDQAMTYPVPTVYTELPCVLRVMCVFFFFFFRRFQFVFTLLRVVPVLSHICTQCTWFPARTYIKAPGGRHAHAK